MVHVQAVRLGIYISIDYYYSVCCCCVFKSTYHNLLAAERHVHVAELGDIFALAAQENKLDILIIRSRRCKPQVKIFCQYSIF